MTGRERKIPPYLVDAYVDRFHVLLNQCISEA